MKFKNKILITGVAGFIGFSVAQKILKNKDIKIAGIDNLNKYYSTKLKLKRLKILNKEKTLSSIKLIL